MVKGIAVTEDQEQGLGTSNTPVEGVARNVVKSSTRVPVSETSAPSATSIPDPPPVVHLSGEVQEELERQVSIRTFELEERLDKLDEKLATVANGTITQEPGTNDLGLFAQMTGQVNCPLCGLLLQGYTPTGIKSQYYTHPFDQSPALGGKPCQLKGKRFRPAVVFLAFTK